MMVRMKYIGEERKKAILDFFLCPIHPTSFTYGPATVTSHCNLFLIMRRPIRCYDYAICYNVACTADETKLLLSPSAKQRLNPCSGSPPENQDLSTRLKTQPLFPSLASRPVFPSSAQGSTKKALSPQSKTDLQCQQPTSLTKLNSVMSVCETAPKTLNWVPICLPGFEYVP